MSFKPSLNFNGFTLGKKVVVVFIGALVLLGALAWGFSKPWRGPWRDQLPKVVWINLRSHLIGVVDKLGNPPNEARAHEILEELRLDLLVRENDVSLFSTTVDIPAWKDVADEIKDEERLRDLRPGSLRSRLGDFIVGRVKGRMFAVVERHGRSHVFFLPEREGFQAGLRAFSGFAFTIAFLLIVILAVTNWLLKPMKPLMVGVHELSQGNLGYRVSIRERGEFNKMAEAFNGMAEKIQEQLKSKDRLLMDVSHELRSPLGRIKMAAEMLSENGSGSALRSQIQTDVREMEDLVSELLELYRLSETDASNSSQSGRLRREPVDLGLLVREVLSPYLSNSQSSPAVRYQVAENISTLEADARLLKRALRNVVENAVKFSKHQDRPVEVRVRREDLAAGEKPSSKYVIEIEDFGIGMTEEQRQRIFEPFYRADSSRVRETGGFGLGLSMAHAIVKSHGGTIVSKSREIAGRSTGSLAGSLFVIELPVSI